MVDAVRVFVLTVLAQLVSFRRLVAFIALLGAAYSVYYVLPVYACVDSWHEGMRWSGCGEDETHWCERESTRGDLILYVRVPRWVSDFLEEPVEVTLFNTSDEDPVESAVVTLGLQTFEGARWSPLHHLYAGEDGEDEPRNSLVFPEIPPQGYVTRSFRLRVSGEPSGEIQPYLLLNGEPFESVFDVDMEFSRGWSLWLWFVRVFWLPPGLNWVILFCAGYFTLWCSAHSERKRSARERTGAPGGQAERRLAGNETPPRTDLSPGSEPQRTGATDAGEQAPVAVTEALWALLKWKKR